MSSFLAKQLTGTAGFAATCPVTPVEAWLQEQVRQGILATPVASFLAGQPEVLDQDQVVVERIEQGLVRCAVPCFSRDHESPKVVCHRVEFELNPKTGEVLRRG